MDMNLAQMAVVHRLLQETGERTRKKFESLGIEAGPLETLSISAAMVGELIEHAEGESKETLTRTISQLLTGFREIVNEGAERARRNPIMEMLAKLGLTMEGAGAHGQGSEPDEDEEDEEFELGDDHHDDEESEPDMPSHANCERCPKPTLPPGYRERTPEEVNAALGREATLSEFRSANCKCAGEEPSHTNCGWCPEHDRPRCDCKCEVVYAVNEEAAGG